MIFTEQANIIAKMIVGEAKGLGGASGGKFFTVGLSKTQPNADGSGITEPDGYGYSRAKICKVRYDANDNTSYYNYMNTGIDDWNLMSTPSNGVIKNAKQIVFSECYQEGASAGGWGLCEWYVIYCGTDSNAKPIISGKLKTPINPTVGQIPVIRPGELSITILDEDATV